MLEVENLTVDFATPSGNLRAVDGVDLTLAERETVAIVGESGSGKSVLSRTLINLLAGNGTRGGTIRIGGRDIDQLLKAERKHFFGVEVAMIFQDPMTSLNPVKRIGTQITEAMRFHLNLSASAAEKRALTLLELVHIPSPARRMKQYPHELSGGMRQRVVIAMALACEPRLLVADEPTTALDVTVQQEILDLFRDLQDEFGMAILFVTHDLAVAADICDRISVMYAGEMVEMAEVKTLFDKPLHPYTAGLLRAMPHASGRNPPLPTIRGNVPRPGLWPAGCRFSNRCDFAVDVCQHGIPLTGGERLVRCIRV
ncbi:MAG: ABC transporter ATP-binding protein, partial [Ilumatobacter sp.]|nr:ABC transporter ATP-binding protein [Ilumatobacter sp.]